MARPAGTSNRNRQFLLNKLKEMYGDDFEPIMQMSKNCMTQQKKADVFLKEVDDDISLEAVEATVNLLRPINDQWEKIAQYTYPKLKAIEVQAENVDPFAGVSREDLLLRLQLLERIALGDITRDSDDKRGDSEEG